MGLFDIFKKKEKEPEKKVIEGELAKNENGTPELYEKVLQKLIELNEGFITIATEKDDIIQVAAGGDTLYLNITTYPGSEHPDEKLKNLGISLPEGTTFSEWEENAFAEYCVPASKVNELASAIESLYNKMFNEPEGYTVSIFHEV